MKRYLRITEYVWMVLAILCACVTIYYFIMQNNENGVFSMVMTLFTGIMYSLRRRFNRHVERSLKRQADSEEKSGN